MNSNIIYPQGGGGIEITIPATESVAIYTKDVAKVYRKLGYPNQPASYDLIGTVTDGETVFGAYASGATIIIEAGASPVLYNVGVSPTVTEIYASQYQGTPNALNATGTISAVAVKGGILTSTTAAAVVATLATGTVMDSSGEFSVGDSIDWSVINTGGANAFTVTASTGHTVVGAGAVAASTSGMFRTRKTAANTFETYRIG